MGCVPSCSLPCCCCCVDITCCPCCPCFPRCGCRCQNGRCHCRCDPFRKYDEGTANWTSGVPKTGSNGRDGKGEVAGGGQGPTSGARGAEGQQVTDPVLGHVIRPSSSVSRSTGMEPQVSDDSRSPSMISDRSLSDDDEGFADSTTSDDAERDGVCIDGKFYPKSARAPSARSTTTKDGRQGACSGELTITNIISVHIADKGSQRSRRRQEEEEGLSQQPPLAAPRRLAKINIKEERKKMMSELSRFKKKKSKRRKQSKYRVDGEVNASFEQGVGDPVTQMQVMEESSSSPTSARSPRSLHISSADDDSSGLDKVRTVNVVSSKSKNASKQTSTNDVKRNARGEVTSHRPVETSSSSSKGEDMETSHGGDLSTSLPSGDQLEVTSHTGSQLSADQGATTNNTSSSQASDSHVSGSTLLKKLAKSRSGRTPASGGLFTAAAALTSTPMSRPSDRAANRGLAMSRHFQGQNHRFSSYGASAAGTTTGGVSASVNVNVRPMSARTPAAGGAAGGSSGQGGGATPTGMTRHDSMWTLAGDQQGVQDLSDPGGRAAHSATNSDQDSVGSGSHARPQSNYGIRSHSEAVHSLQRWRNLKVNPF